MNQILVTEKIYLTPELKRKNKIYKLRFFVSIFLMCLLFSYYIYAEYDRNKSEEVSQQILSELNTQNKFVNNTEDNTVKNIVNDVLIVSLDKQASDEEENKIAQNAVQTTGTVVYASDDGTDYTTEAVLKIPSLDIDYPVLSETSEELLKISLNKYWGPKPNEIGNYCIVGHNYKNGKMFGKLSQMQIGDTAILTDMRNKSITYEAYDKYDVSPTDVACTSQLTGGKKEITLITCTNYGTRRLVIKCREV